MGIFDMIGSMLEFVVDRTQKEKDRQERIRSRAQGRSSSSNTSSLSSSRNKKSTTKHRGTKEDFRKDMSNMEKDPRSFSIGREVYLNAATMQAPSQEGVYIIYLDGEVMKCGTVTYSQGLLWRFTQYYNLNYDDKARDGNYWSVSPENRDREKVSWQACPKRVCDELEYKLFSKYGKGRWAKRAPEKLATDEWELLI